VWAVGRGSRECRRRQHSQQYCRERKAGYCTPEQAAQTVLDSQVFLFPGREKACREPFLVDVVEMNLTSGNSAVKEKYCQSPAFAGRPDLIIEISLAERDKSAPSNGC
jgi:hypothetical protein